MPWSVRQEITNYHRRIVSNKPLRYWMIRKYGCLKITRSYCHKVRLVKPCTTVCSDGKNSASTLLTENFKSTITWSRTRSVRSLSEERITCLPDHTTGHEERPCCTLSWELAKSMM